ncbi:MAG TPA: DUF3566 domain-containing protein [Terriglobales bacterium]|jgi:hypothetical protein|nr:DUF3566 domain-containing protein [Terriglobales bacterium]
MYSLRSVDVISCAQMMGMIYGCLGLIALPFFLLGGFINLLLGSQSSQPLAGIAIWFLALLVPVVYGLMGFVMGALGAWVYNLIARWIGGIKLELEPIVTNSQSNIGLI